VQHRALCGEIKDWAGNSAPGGAGIFGADRHLWHLSAPLSERRVADWESDIGVSIPEEYRVFLTEIGHTGMGPSYGMEGLYTILTNPHRGEQQKPWMRRFYQAPCLYHPDREGGGDEWLADVIGEDWEARYDDETFDPQQGTLTLSQHGCGYETVLVLNGEFRGRVANVYFTDPAQFTQQTGFLAWYEGWLDTTLISHAPSWYGYPRREPVESST
ncbi:MAG: SMI1/KNR4 family protein, partial [Akkermansiaceae bacterium]|nr:SMI1/KNR4 family protein [Armatimonadota bacterium]